MLKMSNQLENIISAYKTLSKIPAIVGGKLNRDANRITSTWSVRNLDKGKNTKYVSTYHLQESDLKVIAQSDFGTDVSNELLSAVSPCETYKAVIREEKNGKDAKKQYLEVWDKSTLAHCVDLTALDIHGDVYADSEFGSLDWAPDEKSLVYIAEKKLPKSEPYIKRKGPEIPKADGSGETAPQKGQEFIYRQDWGEQLVGKYLSVIVVCKVPSETFTVLEGLPESCTPGQVRFTPEGDSVVGVAWETKPRRLGLIFCTNRPSYIFNLTLTGTLTKLSAEGLAVRSPRFSPTGDLVWLQREAGGPHHACHQLVMMKKGSSAVTTITDIVQHKSQTAGGRDFFGLYCQALPRNCFTKDGKRIVLATPQENEVRAYVIDIESGRVSDVSNRSSPGSTSVLDVQDDVVLASCSDLQTPGVLFVARLPPQGSEQDIWWVQVSERFALPSSVTDAHTDYMQLEHKDSTDECKSFNAIYFGPAPAPASEQERRCPLVVWPHGGPHSNFVNAYSLEAALFNMLGFACLQINYRGSTGAGDASVRFLPQRVGSADVLDCKLATDEAVHKYPVDPAQLCLAGGSHGGFLVTHLSGQFPDTYAAVVSRNPVVDVATMFNSTDIPDWYYKNKKTILPNKLLLGFASVRINYRGSIGQGDATNRCLISHVGDYDVKDCYLALTTLLERDRRIEQLFLYGGSYGGLVVAHLAALYPQMFRAMVMRNPLIDLATKGSYADNSDGCAVEAGFPFSERGALSEAQLLGMRRASPLAHVQRVRAPTALMLGSGDKRVPHYQGLEYARRLKANGVPTRIYMYDDNHSLSSPPAEMDNLINGVHWFLQHLNK